MSHGKPQDNERLIELSIDFSTTGLSGLDQQEFEELASSSENRKEAERFELTAAALDLSYNPFQQESMPRDVHDRLLVAAGQFFGSGRQTTSRSDHKVELAPRSAGNRFSWREAIALAVTAACLVLMLSGLNPFAKAPIAQIPDQKPTVEKPSPPAVVLTPSEQMESLLADAPSDLIDIPWKPVQAANASGKVIWSDQQQEGFMVLSGLKVNNPSQEQYQLWIFDTDPKQAYPVDGGVFDVSAAGEIVIPIDAKIHVNQAVQFAITMEKSGGVVVSNREKIPLLASID